MQTLGFYPRSTESGSLGVGPRHPFEQAPGDSDACSSFRSIVVNCFQSISDGSFLGPWMGDSDSE